jgi:hypothetical protein
VRVKHRLILWKVLAFIMFDENKTANVPEVLGNAYLSELVSVLQSIILLRRCTPVNGSVP